MFDIDSLQQLGTQLSTTTAFEFVFWVSTVGQSEFVLFSIGIGALPFYETAIVATGKTSFTSRLTRQ